MNRFHKATLLLFVVYLHLSTAKPVGRINSPKSADDVDKSVEQEVLENAIETAEIHTDLNAEHKDGEILPQLLEDHAPRSSSSAIFQNILNNMKKGQVTQESLNQWLNQIQTAMSRGTISSQSVNGFLSTLKEKFAGTSFGDTCCIIG